MNAVGRVLTGRYGALWIAVLLVGGLVGLDQLLRAIDPSSGFIERIHFIKFRDELKAFYQEIVVLDAPRYRDVMQWPRLWVDFWNALFGCHYTLGHVVGIGLPAYWLAHVIRRALRAALGR